MTPLFKKLNFKSLPEIVALNAPSTFEIELEEMEKVASIVRETNKIKHGSFVIAFATKQAEVNQFAKTLVAKTTPDGVLWICYPKGTSKKYTCDFNRDTGWAIFGTLGFEPVRQVAIDEDWSALRFKRVEQIQKMTRSFAMTEEGKRKAASSKQ